MIDLKKYKIFAYLLLAAVIVVSFLLTSLILGLVVNAKLSSYNIVYVILNLLLNFSMFFICFKLMQTLVEKETTISELHKQHVAKEEDISETEASSEVKDFNADEIVQQIVPQAPQNMGIEKFCEKVLANIGKVSELVQGIIYIKDPESGQFVTKGKYAYYANQNPPSFYESETLNGQVAKDKKIVSLNNVPSDYFTVVSGLGKSVPGHLIIIPVVDKDVTIAIIELASFKAFDKDIEKVYEKLAALLSKIILKIKN